MATELTPEQAPEADDDAALDFVSTALKGGGRVTTIVLNLSSSGAAAYILDPGTGKPSKMIVGTVAFVVGNAVHVADPTYFVGRLRHVFTQDKQRPRPSEFGFDEHDWYSLIATLNGPSRVARTRALAVYSALVTIEAPIEEYVHQDRTMWGELAQYRAWTRTDRAKDIDSERDGERNRDLP